MRQNEQMEEKWSFWRKFWLVVALVILIGAVSWGVVWIILDQHRLRVREEVRDYQKFFVRAMVPEVVRLAEPLLEERRKGYYEGKMAWVMDVNLGIFHILRRSESLWKVLVELKGDLRCVGDEDVAADRVRVCSRVEGFVEGYRSLDSMSWAVERAKSHEEIERLHEDFLDEKFALEGFLVE